MIHGVWTAFSRLREFRNLFSDNDDGVDRLHRFYSCCLLLLSASIIGMKQFAGAPIDCWCPGQFTQSHINYANSICWVNGTYYVPFGEQLPQPDQPKSIILYYQWVPFILLGQSFAFTIPGLFWRIWSDKLGMNVASVIDAVKSTHYIGAELNLESDIICQKHMKQTIYKVITYLRGRGSYERTWKNNYQASHNEILAHYDVIRMERIGKPGSLFRCLRTSLTRSLRCLFLGRPTSGKLCGLYLSMKLLNLMNACLQFLLMHSFLNITTHDNLYQTFTSFLEKISLEKLVSLQLDPGRFPKVTMCDFHIRQQINLHRYSVQCVLSINLFNEKVFFAVWAWLMALILVTLFNIFSWIPILFLSCQVQQTRRLLASTEHGETVGARSTEKFLASYLGRDGALVIKLVSLNSEDPGAALLLRGLWRDYKFIRRVGERSETSLGKGKAQRPMWREMRRRCQNADRAHHQPSSAESV